MKTSLKAAVALVVALPALALAQAKTYEIDPVHSNVDFTVRHMMVSNVRGHFKTFKGTVAIDDKALANSNVDVTIDAASINTDNEKRDAHLRSPDFFDVAQYPTLTFKSTKVQKAGKGYKVTGDLTLHGVTKPVVLNVSELTPEVKDPWGNLKRGATATTEVSRQAFGLKWNQALETGGAVVGDKVTINLALELGRKAEQPAAATPTSTTEKK